ncbi:hypothetical protein [Nonomuraea basaltis]|nr:hypothetical protein [Nonomuraea basaltis]
MRYRLLGRTGQRVRPDRRRAAAMTGESVRPGRQAAAMTGNTGAVGIPV